MTLPLTSRARLASNADNITPNLVFQIEGVDTKYGAVNILKYIRIGDPGLEIGNDWRIGGFSSLEDQTTAITFDGTTTTIAQKLDIDKSSGSSVSQMAIALVDINEEITRLITPGEVVEDLLGRKATVWLGFANTGFPDDYIRIFRGVIDDINAFVGKVSFQLSHPDQKKRQDIFIKADTTLNGGIGSGDTTINLTSTTDFAFPITGANGMEDSSIQYGVRIEDEIIFYTSISGNQLLGCTRGALGTSAVGHADDSSVESFIRFGAVNAIDAALKIMLSGWNDYYQEDVPAQNFNQLGDINIVQDSIFFQGIDIADEYGVVVGDYLTTTGATDGANNVTLQQITQVVKTDEGSYVVVDGAGFVDELDTAALVSFRSQYDTLHPNCGLKLHNNEVDIKQHELIKRRFLSSFEYDFYMRDTVNGKEFLEEQVYFPCAAYTLPRKSQSSVGYHIGPLPDSDIKILDQENTVGASKLSIRRSISKNFYNTIVYKYEEKVLEEDKFTRGVIETDNDSRDRIEVGTRALIIPAKGIREVLSGQTVSENAAFRRLRRYKFSAEYIEGFQVVYGDSYNVEIGDILVLDMAELMIADSKNATRAGEPRLMEVYNKTFDIKTGKVTLALLDTAYSTASRYCLMSPASRLDSGSTSTTLKLVRTGNSVFGTNEGGKWSRYLGAAVRVRSDDFTTRNDTSFIQSVSGNTLTLDTALSFTPQAGDTLTLAHYTDMSGEIGDRLKLIYGFMHNTPTFDNGDMLYQMI